MDDKLKTIYLIVLKYGFEIYCKQLGHNVYEISFGPLDKFQEQKDALLAECISLMKKNPSLALVPTSMINNRLVIGQTSGLKDFYWEAYQQL